MRFFLILLIISYILGVGLLPVGLYASNGTIKRDPFVPLIDPAGRVKAESELARPVEIFLPLNISLKGVIWSKDKPLAIINNKIYREGAVVFEGLILEKINPDNVILDDRGEKVTIYLRKKEKK